MKKKFTISNKFYRKSIYWMFAILLPVIFIVIIVGIVFLFTRHDAFEPLYIYMVAMGSFAFIMGILSLLSFSGAFNKKHVSAVGPKTFIGKFKLYMCRISERKSFWIRNIALFLIGNLAFATIFIFATNWALWVNILIVVLLFLVWFPLLMFFIGTVTLKDGRFTFYRDSPAPAKIQINTTIGIFFFAAPAIYVTPLILLALGIV